MKLHKTSDDSLKVGHCDVCGTAIEMWINDTTTECPNKACPTTYDRRGQRLRPNLSEYEARSEQEDSNG